MELELSTTAQDWVEVVVNLAIPILVTLIALAVTALAGAGVWKSVQVAAKQIRPYVDEPNDWIIVTLDGIGETTLHRKLDEAKISQLLTAMCDAVVAHTPKTPPAKVNVNVDS